jgi:hypothetical protein
MAEKEKVVANGKDQKIIQHDIEDLDTKVEEVRQLETLIKDQTVASKSFIYVIIALLIYLIFMVIPDIDEKVTFMEKDLNSILVQSERYKKSTRVFTKDNQCASCHLSPDYLLHNLLKKYPSFSDVKSFMSVGHQRYYTMTTPMPDAELLEVYRALQ